MENGNIRLTCKFLLLYICITLFGVSVLTLSNLYMLGLGVESLLKYNFFALFLEGSAGVLFLQGITMMGLRTTRRLLGGFIKSEDDYYKAWNEMVSFPFRIFWGMVGFGIAASVFYHIGALFAHSDIVDNAYYIEIAYVVSFEQTLSLILAILLFTGARHLLRRYILQIPETRINDFRKATFYRHLLTIFCCLLFITVLDIFCFVMNRTMNAKPIDIGVFIGLSLFDVFFGILIFSDFVREMKQDFKILFEAISSLLKGSRAQLKARIPIVSNDEIGSLSLIFNRLQEKVSREYDEIDAELQLACNIQQKLLPEGEKIFGPYRAAGICKPCHEVGGDFFDIVTLEGGNFAVIIGDVVGKGMPAALIMSSVLLLLRNEIQHGGTASELLSRINKMITGLGMDDACLTLGIAVFDTSSNRMQYASSGHVAPYILTGQGIRELESSSLPLGISTEESYEQIEYEANAGDRFVFYTDGIIDAFDNHPVSGFIAFEEILCTVKSDSSSVSRQLDLILESIELSGKSGHGDDKTLLIVKYDG